MLKTVFAGVVRDCAAHLPKVLDNIDRMASIFEDSAFVFVENDSVDATRSLLATWGLSKRNFTLLSCPGLGGLPVRTVRLETARNVYLEFVKTASSLEPFDFLCVMDMDDIGTRPIELADFQAALAFMSSTADCAGIFANQLGSYYDMWALRHRDYCPGDVWYEVLEYAQVHGVSDEEAFARTFRRRIRSFDRDAAPIEVESAFGGLGVYRLSYVRSNTNPYLGSRVRLLRRPGAEPVIYRMQQCEHVHFHQGLRHLGGRLFIWPGLINAATGRLSFQSSGCRRMIF